VSRQAQTGGPADEPRRTGDRGPGQAEILEARSVALRCTGDAGPEGRSRINEVGAA